MTSEIVIRVLQDTNQDEVEATSPPLLHGLFSILGYIILNLLLLHEGRENGLVDGVI